MKNKLNAARIALYCISMWVSVSHAAVWFPCFRLLRKPTLKIVKKDSTTHLSMARALVHAHDYRSSLKARGHAINRFKQLARAEFAGYMPQISLRENVSRSKSGLFPRHQAAIEFRQLILSAAGPFQRYKVANQDIEIARIQQDFEWDIVRAQVEQSMLELWRVVRKQPAIEALDVAAKAVFGRAQTEYTVGLLSEPAWDASVALFAEQTAAVLSYRDEINRAQSDVERAMEGVVAPLNTGRLDAFVEDMIRHARHTTADWYLNRAKQHRKELAIKDEEIVQQEYLHDLNARFYVPEASFFAEVNRGVFSVLSSATSKIFWQVGVELSWQFDGLANAFRAKSASAATEQLRMEWVQLWQDITNQVNTTYDDLQIELKELGAAKQRLDAAESEFKLQAHRHAIGDLSADDFAVAKQLWEDAQFTYHEREIRTAQKHQDLLFKAGYPRQGGRT